MLSCLLLALQPQVSIHLQISVPPVPLHVQLLLLLGDSCSILLVCPTSLLVYLSRRELPSLLPENKYYGHAMLTHT